MDADVTTSRSEKSSLGKTKKGEVAASRPAVWSTWRGCHCLGTAGLFVTGRASELCPPHGLLSWWFQGAEKQCVRAGSSGDRRCLGTRDSPRAAQRRRLCGSGLNRGTVSTRDPGSMLALQTEDEAGAAWLECGAKFEAGRRVSTSPSAVVRVGVRVRLCVGPRVRGWASRTAVAVLGPRV